MGKGQNQPVDAGLSCYKAMAMAAHSGHLNIVELMVKRS